MSRLTFKNSIIFPGRTCGKTFFTNIYKKLGKLEDLMEKYEIDSIENLEHILQVLNMVEIKTQAEYLKELGCPLDVVFKALKDRQVIFKHTVGLENPKITLETHKIAGLLFDGKNYGLWLYENGYDDEFYVYTKDYGKTWWLMKVR